MNSSPSFVRRGKRSSNADGSETKIFFDSVHGDDVLGVPSANLHGFAEAGGL